MDSDLLVTDDMSQDVSMLGLSTEAAAFAPSAFVATAEQDEEPVNRKPKFRRSTRA